MGELLIFAIISTPFVAIFTSGYSVRREASTALVELESKKYVDDGRRKRLASSAILNFSASCCVFLSWAGVSKVLPAVSTAPPCTRFNIPCSSSSDRSRRMVLLLAYSRADSSCTVTVLCWLRYESICCCLSFVSIAFPPFCSFVAIFARFHLIKNIIFQYVCQTPGQY